MEPNAQHVRGELDRILASRVFAGSARLSRFLRFVVERTLAGDGERLKEYVLGVEVFDRSTDYDPRMDSIVRVEAARVRVKLDEYYSGEGAADTVLISIRKGSYAPTFTERAASGAAGALHVEVARTGSRRSWKIAAWALGAVLLVAAGAAWRFASTPADPRIAIAVLPFAPYGADATDQAVATRLTERVTAEFVRRGDFVVVASTSAREVAARGGPLDDVARTLGAEVLLEARLLRENGALVAEARLVSGSRNQKLWVAGIRGTEADVDDLARRIAAAATDAVASAAGRRAAGR